MEMTWKFELNGLYENVEFELCRIVMYGNDLECM